MDISSVGGFAVANKIKVNDDDGDDKGGVKASAKAAAQEVALKSAQNTDNTKPATPTAKSGEEDNVIQPKTPSKQGKVDTLA